MISAPTNAVFVKAYNAILVELLKFGYCSGLEKLPVGRTVDRRLLPGVVLKRWTDTLVPFLKDDGVCSLSDILEPIGGIPRRFFLSRKACSGILRRAASRGRDLPPMLKDALERQIGLGMQAESTQHSTNAPQEVE